MQRPLQARSIGVEQELEMQRGGLAVVNWRQLELEQCGFSPSLAARVARDERYDLHQLIGLVQEGCSPALAVRILSPLESTDTA
jgi:hypothetical protein